MFIQTGCFKIVSYSATCRYLSYNFVQISYQRGNNLDIKTNSLYIGTFSSFEWPSVYYCIFWLYRVLFLLYLSLLQVTVKSLILIISLKIKHYCRKKWRENKDYIFLSST